MIQLLPNRPRVSVIVPLYNQERYVEAAIRSVFEQTCTEPLEIIVVDDGSTDTSADIVSAMAGYSPRHPIHLLRQANSGGPARPRNAALAVARGDYIAFLDPDDYWYPTKLERQLQHLDRHPEVAMSFSDARIVFSEGESQETYLGRVGYLGKANHVLSALGGDVYLGDSGFYEYSSAGIAGMQTSGVVIRKKLLDEQPEYFPEHLRVGEDLDLWFRLMAKHPTLFVNQALHAYRIHQSSLMHQASRVHDGAITTHMANFRRVENRLNPAQRKIYRKRIARMLESRGYDRRLRGEFRDALHDYFRSLGWHPSVASLRGVCVTLLFMGRAIFGSRPGS